MDKRITARNINTSILYDGSMDTDFISDPIDFKEMALGFVQAIYKDNTTHQGSFRLLASGRIELETFAVLPGTEMAMDDTCPAVGWNLCCLGYRFLRVQYI